MEPWKKKTGMLRGTRFVTQLNPLERETLGNCAATVADALMERVRTAPKDELAELTGMASGHSEPPSSPALARILPNFFAEGAEKVEGDAALTRQLNETEIIKSKLMNLALIAEHIGPDGSVNITLSQEEVQPWLSAINDVRNYYHELCQPALHGAEGPDRVEAAKELIAWLAFHQDSLLQAMMGELPTDLMDNPGDSSSQSRGEATDEGPEDPQDPDHRSTGEF